MHYAFYTYGFRFESHHADFDLFFFLSTFVLFFLYFFSGLRFTFTG